MPRSRFDAQSWSVLTAKEGEWAPDPMAAGGGQSRMPTRGFVLKMAGANLVAAMGYGSVRERDA
jgi:hypothetical protein